MQKQGSLTQAQRTAISDKAMLEAASDLVLEHGTEKTTLAMIGERAGYSRGLATYRYGTKGGLFDALFKSLSHQWLDYLKAGIGDEVGIEAMCLALDAMRHFVDDHPRAGRVLQILHAGAASPSAEFSDTARGIHQRQRSDVADWVRAGQERGEIRADANPDAVAHQYVSYIIGTTHMWLMSADEFDFSTFNAEMKRQLRASLAAN